MDMSLEMAQNLISKAIEQAGSDYGRPICIAVCDNHGLLVAFARMPGVTLRSIPISQRKAYTAAFMGVDTDAFAQRLQRENLPASYFCDEQLTGLAGGIVLKNAAGVAIGAAGVSGLTPQEDQTIAKMMAALSEKA